MHPLVARIHPAIRISALTSLATIGIYAALGNATFLALWPVTTWLISTFSLTLAVATIAQVLLLFLAMLFAGVAVYHWTRRDGMPQTADRAVLLFLLGPWAWILVAQPVWLMASVCSLWAFVLAGRGRTIWAMVLISLALVFRVEAMLVFPVLFYLVLPRMVRDKPWELLALALPVATSVFIIFTKVFGGYARQLSTVRAREFSWQGVTDLEFVLITLLIAFFVFVAFATRKHHEMVTSMLTAVFLLGFFFVHEPPREAIAVLTLTPVFAAHLASFCREAGVERWILLASVIGYLAFV